MRIKVLLFGSPGHGSFNLCGLAGVESARRVVHGIDLIWIESAGPAIRAARLIDICQQGADLVIAYGPAGDHPVALAAKRFPHMHFAVVQGSHTAENVAAYGVKQEQSAFLAGILAAAESRTGGLGHLSGVKSDSALLARAAYVDGVQRHAPGSGMLTSFCGSQDDSELAFDTCEAMARRGVDIVFAAVDGGRAGATRACKKFRLRQIGCVLDWTERDTDAEVFLGSAVSDAGRCIAAAVRDFAAGAMEFGRERRFGVERPEFVRLAMGPSAGHRTRETIDHWTHALASGQATFADSYGGREFELGGLLSRI